MIKFSKWLLVVMLTCYTLTATSQITVRYTDLKKDYYSVGEVIVLKIKMKCAPQTCLSGMKQTKIFVSGLQIEDQTDWQEVSKATFQKQLQLKILPGKKKESKLTILRKVDKESLFHQELFRIK